jgi:iron complex outermembrane recepter protein
MDGALWHSRRWYGAAALAGASLWAAPAAAQTPTEPEPAVVEPEATATAPAPAATPAEPQPDRASELEPEEAVVRGRGAPPRGAGDVNITVGQLGQVPRSGAGDLLRLAPGMFLSNGLGEGHADQVFLRGFDARSGQDLEFTVNGVPINEPAHPHGQGYADTHFLIPELVESLRVLEGPFDPRQGDFAVAGSAQYTLRLPARGAHIQYRFGSYNTHRVLALWGPDGERAGTFGGVELGSSDGYGQNRSYERATANAQYEGRSGSLTWRALVMSYGIRYRSAGVVREDDLLAGRIGFYDTYDATQGSEVSRHLVSAEVESTHASSVLRAQAWASLRSFRLRENFTGSLLDVQQPYQSPHAQRGDLIDQSASTVDVGARASARLRTIWRTRPQSVELGAYARHNTVDSTQQRLRATTDVPYLTDYSLGNSVSNLALYLDVELRPLTWVVLRGGLRADLFQYDVLDRCAVSGVTVRGAPLDAECLSADRSGYRSPTQRRTAGGVAWQPRGALLLGPWKGVTVALSAGLGARSADPVYLGNDQQLPFSPITALEGGAVFDRHLHGFALSARALYFRTHVGQDLIFNEAEGRNTLASGTTRQGALLAARATNRPRDLRRRRRPRAVRAAVGGALRRRAQPPAPVAHPRARGDRLRGRRGHLGGAAPAALLRARRDHLHRRRAGRRALGLLRARLHGPEPLRLAVRLGSVQLRERLPQPRVPHARARAALHRGPAEAAVRGLHTAPRRLRRAARCATGAPPMNRRAFAFALALALTASSGCGDTTGSRRVSFTAEVGGVERDGAQALTFTNDQGWEITLTQARLAFGPMYLNTIAPLEGRAPVPLLRRLGDLLLPSAYADGESHLGVGRIVGQVTTQVIVDALDPAAAAIPGGGDGVGDAALTAEAWLFNRADGLDGAAARVAGTARRDGLAVAFEGALVIDASLVSAGGSIDEARKVRGIPARLTPSEGGVLRVRIDPRGWFEGADFRELTSGSPRDGRYQFTASDNVGRAFINRVRSRATFAVTFSPAR